jgi:hypothetical protein
VIKEIKENKYMSTSTFTGTDSYSVSDVKAVMQNTYEDIIGFANRNLMTYETAEKWIEDLTYLLKKEILNFFEIQLYDASGNRFKSYRYTIDTWGILSIGDKSGGINFFEIPATTKIGLLADLKKEASNYSNVIRELTENRGWGVNGSAMVGNSTHEKNYVSNSLQLKRSVITKI